MRLRKYVGNMRLGNERGIRGQEIRGESDSRGQEIGDHEARN